MARPRKDNVRINWWVTPKIAELVRAEGRRIGKNPGEIVGRVILERAKESGGLGPRYEGVKD